MSPCLDRQSRFAASIGALALEYVPTIRAVDLPAHGLAELIHGRSEISSGLAGVADDDLAVAIHESDLGRSLIFLHAATILALSDVD